MPNYHTYARFIILLITCGSIFTSGCGKDYVKKASLRVDGSILLFDIKFGPPIKVKFGFRQPLENVPGGFIELVPGGFSGTNAHLIVGVDLNVLGSDPNVGIVFNRLPNGDKLPKTVQGKMIALYVKLDSFIDDCIIYIGIEKKEIGIGIPIEEVDILPPFFKFTEKIDSHIDVTLYGPAKASLDTSNVLFHGGLFVHASLEDNPLLNTNLNVNK